MYLVVKSDPSPSSLLYSYLFIYIFLYKKNVEQTKLDYSTLVNPGAEGVGGDFKLGKLFRGEKRSKETKRRKGGKKKDNRLKNRDMVGKKGKWEAKTDDFVVKIFGEISNWDWERGSCWLSVAWEAALVA